jgi:hypothetical protein
VNENASHSCVRRSVDEFLAGKPAHAIRLFERFLAEVRGLGPVALHSVRTRVALMVEVRFAAINRFHDDYIDGHLWLKERPHSTKFRKIDVLGRNFISHFRADDEAFFDAEFRRYLRKSYAIGRRR